MTKRNTILIAIMLIATTLQAQNKNERDNILSLCGCYDVKFEYAETFKTDSNYQFHDDKIAGARELIIPIQNDDKKIVLQHMLIVNDNYIIKHWREEWTYEQTQLLSYIGDNQWKKQTLQPQDVKNKWTQTVWQVDDMPRYQGYSSWINNDNKTYWESTSYAPLPRREYTKRSDYNIMLRTNKIIVTEDGWVHEQDNQKIIRKNGHDSLLVKEKGLNTYTKVDPTLCAAAQKHWDENIAFWNIVKAQWNKYIDNFDVLKLKTTVDDKMLFAHFYELEYNWKEEKWSNHKLEKEIIAIMNQFVVRK